MTDIRKNTHVFHSPSLISFWLIIPLQLSVWSRPTIQNGKISIRTLSISSRILKPLPCQFMGVPRRAHARSWSMWSISNWRSILLLTPRKTFPRRCEWWTWTWGTHRFLKIDGRTEEQMLVESRWIFLMNQTENCNQWRAIWHPSLSSVWISK